MWRLFDAMQVWDVKAADQILEMYYLQDSIVESGLNDEVDDDDGIWLRRILENVFTLSNMNNVITLKRTEKSSAFIVQDIEVVVVHLFHM
jgi:hypothetical protein